MSKKKLIVLVATIGLVFTSCQDFLDTKPTGSLTETSGYSSTALVKAAVANMYYGLRYTNGYGQYYSAYMNVSTDESFFYSNATSFPYGGYFNRPDDGTQIKGFWTDIYKSVNAANMLLKNIEASASGYVDSTTITRAKGEALFLRGYYYFLLTQWFGDVPLFTTPFTNPQDILVMRTPQKEVYDQIIKDMIQAEPMLKGQDYATLGYTDRVTQDAVQGILARVFLYAAGEPVRGTNKYTQSECYHQAAVWASKVIKTGTHYLEQDGNNGGVPGVGYQSIFKKECQDQYSPECIWEVGYSHAGTGTVSPAGGIGVYCGINHSYLIDATNYDGYCENKVKLHSRLYLSYEPGDYRRDWNCAGFTYKNSGYNTNAANYYNDAKVPLAYTSQWSRSPGKWRREYESSTTRTVRSSNGTNFPILRYADVLLMYAEALNEIDSMAVNGCAMDKAGAINAVRARSISSTPVIEYITWTQGTGYTSDPMITVSGGGGSGAVVSVASTYRYNTPTSRTIDCLLTCQGSGYSSAPTITIGNQWTANATYTVGTQLAAPNGKLYTVTRAGTTGTTAPTHTSGSIANGTTLLVYAGTAARATAILSETPSPELPAAVLTDKVRFRAAVMMERYHELCFEALRQQDLRRWGVLIPTVQDLKNDLNGTYTTSFNQIVNQDPTALGASLTMIAQPFIRPLRAYANEITTSGAVDVPMTPVNNIETKDLYWPIPATEIAIDNLLTQNPGY